MPKEQSNNRRATPEEALSGFLEFVQDPTNMDEEELDAYLAQAGFNFDAFSERLDKDIDAATRKGRLVAAREGRASFVENAKRAVEVVALSIEQKRTEIQQRLGLLGGQAAAVFNRNYELAEDEEDLDDLLTTLRSLDERSDGEGNAS